MKALYLDLFSGISGDMLIGALLDLGVEPAALEQELGKLGLKNCHIHISRQTRGTIAGTKFDVHAGTHGPGHDERTHPHRHSKTEGHQHVQDEPEPERSFAQIKQLIEGSRLSSWVKTKSVAVFERLAEAEGKIHGRPVDQVHFHEVGALDSIVDIVGACIALELLGRPRVLAGPVVEGRGMVHCAHGSFPLPAPATLELLSARGIPIQQCEEPHELVTPTGAALLAEFAESFEPMRDFIPSKIGYGLGSRENDTRPNVLRALLGETADRDAGEWETDTVAVLETNLDDITPEILGAFMEKALGAGALDVFYTPIQMKKNRPGVMLSLLCTTSEADRFSRLLLEETSAFGVRCVRAERRKLKREFTQVTTPFGEVTLKIGRLGGQVVQVAPEYESCRALAEKHQVPLKQIYEAALKTPVR